MPYPAQVNRDSLIEKARMMIEADGIEQLSLHGLAAVFGIKAPSLYRHIGNKDGLLQAVNVRTSELLFDAINEALAEAADEPAEKLMALSRAYRNFAHSNPQTYILSMTNTVAAWRPDEEYLLQLVLPLQALVAEVCGQENSLAALRGLLALMHGFVLLELTEQLRRGGNLETAYMQSIAAYLRGWR